jgi:retinol-binding protein 3
VTRVLPTIALLVAAAIGPTLSTRASAQPQGSAPTPALVHDTVQSLAAAVEREYFDPAIGGEVRATLLQRLAAGRYAGADTADALARMLTADLFELTRDKHLAVSVVTEPGPGTVAPRTDRDDSREAAVRRTNAGVQRVEVLAGNVGYLNLTTFFRPDEARQALAAAMQVLQRADALILDMRDNVGGSPETAALLASYFFEEPGLPLFDIADRSGTRRGYATQVPAPLERNATRPTYVLTAARTFSAGEGLAYILQDRGRAEIVGELTAGAANPGRSYPINARFSVVVPNGRVIAAVSGGNWEGAGVVPEVPAPAADALRVAHARALRALIARTPAGPWRETLARDLAQLDR